MCGIYGFSTGKDKKATDEILERMQKALAHRGPNDSGTFTDQNIALGNVLLSIIDVPHGSQPFTLDWKDERYICIYNGEIYNHKTIRKELEGIGISFSTKCDTEVAIAAYAAWGVKALERFEGQWAIAVWETRKKRLFLSRDPFGIKPLFYYYKDKLFAFASEPKALFEHQDISKQPNTNAIVEYFMHGFTFAAGYASPPRSFYKDIYSLNPGHFLLWDYGRTPEIKQYFQIPLDQELPAENINDIIPSLRKVVEDSVKSCLMSDVPVGIALSGGLDSSIITSVAAREYRRLSKEPILVSTITYDGQSLNEDASHAGILEQALRDEAPINLVQSSLSTDNYLKDLDSMIYHFDEPHWEVKQLAMFNNYKELKKNGATVVLTGEGADELSLGYFHRFPGFLNPVINSADSFQQLWRNRMPAVMRLFAGDASKTVDTLMADAIERFYQPYQDMGSDPARRMQCWYLNTFLHWLLIDNDRCSMAHSIEGRFPYLNRSVFELALQIPTQCQVGGKYGQEKLLLRKAFKDLLPEAIQKRPKAPLPSPAHIGFHKVLCGALQRAAQETPSSIWSILDKTNINDMISEFERAVASLYSSGKIEKGGEELTRYIYLSEPLQIRTPQMFGLLTLLRWWTINY